jgi:hypothetical protein
MKKSNLFKVVILLISTLNSYITTKADVIYESATMGPTGQTSGWTIDNEQSLGTRFYISQTTQITAIGGRISNFTYANIFGAIVKLDNFSDFPDGAPLKNEDVIAYTVFSGGYIDSDYRTPLSTILSPGYYALVFGSGLYGTTGSAMMPYADQIDLGTPQYICWDSFRNPQWFDPIPLQARFVIEGTVVPEPATLLLFGLGAAILRKKR